MSTSEKLIDKLLAKLVKQGTLAVTHASGATRTFGTATPGFSDVAIRFADRKAARDILLDPRLGAGEAYMDGRIVIETGDVMDFVSLMRMNARWENKRRLAPPSLPRRISGRISTALRAVNRPGSSRRNVAHHYDIGNSLYQLMLDAEHMQYSCALWDTENCGEDMTLAEAQEAKLAHIAAKLNLTPGLKVLDIGCGWGGMAIFLAARVADRVSFELVDYRDLAARGESYDRIVSVGMFEHVGVPQFETFFRACAQMLAEDGCMLLHTIGRMGSPGRTDAFTNKWIFPGGYIPALSETVAASEKVRLIATDVETLRLHYARTIRAWYANVLAHREEIIAQFDERFYRLWTFYLAGAATSFECGGMCNYQIQYARERRALPLTRDYIARAEGKLLARS